MLGWTSVWLASAACTRSPARPGYLGDCPDAAKSCTSPPPVGQTPQPEAGPDGSASDAAGDASIALSGSVLVFQDASFALSVPFAAPAQVVAQGANGASVSGDYDGSDPFQISGVLKAASVWMTVTPTTSASDALPTLQPVDTAGSSVIQLYLVRSSALDSIYSVLTQPVTRQAGASQFVLRFEDASAQTPVANVAVTQQPGGTVLYDSGGTWSDTATGTGQLGMAIVANAQPGVSQPVDFQVGSSGAPQAVTLRAAAGAVSYASVAVQP